MFRRIYVEKKEAYAVHAKQLEREIREFLGIKKVSLRYLIRYDVENVSDTVFFAACRSVFSEPPVDTLYEEEFETGEDELVFAVEALPGQFDQRTDSAEQCIRFLRGSEEPIVRTAEVYALTGIESREDLEKIKDYVMNPVDSRIAP